MDDNYCYDYDDEDEIENNEYYDEDEEYTPPPVTFSRLKSQASMIFFRLDDIKRVLDKKIDELRELLDTSYDETLILFHYFNWNRDKLENSDWFSNQEELSKKAGLIPTVKNENNEGNVTECPVCMGECTDELLDGLGCGHKLCKCCWEHYINEQVECNANSFFWHCPGQTEGKNCTIVIPDSFNRKYLKKENETQYNKKLCISYAEENKAVRWCPAPDCIYAVENPSLTTRTIRCRCSMVFCFKCGIEEHYPCSCSQAKTWLSKNREESENTKWVSVYTKACPKCQRPIEKNQGCNHMVCKHKGCDYEFCWLCLEEWKQHQGSFYKCNKFEVMAEEEKEAEGLNCNKEKAELERYVFYFERFSNSERTYCFVKDLHQKMEQNVTDLHSNFNMPYAEVNFLTEATDILQKAHKTLKWTYVHAYYITEQKTKDLFEFHQKDLERYCEELDEMLEMHYNKSVRYTGKLLDLKTFLTYKDQVVNSSFKTQKFTNEVCKVIEEGLEKFSSPQKDGPPEYLV